MPGGKAVENFGYPLILAVLLALPILILPNLHSFSSLAKVALVRLSAAAILLVFAWQALNGRLRYRTSMLVVPLAVFTGLLIISSAASQNPVSSIFGSYSSRFEELPTWLAYFVLFLAGLNYLDEYQKVRAAANFLLAGAALVSVYAIVQHFGIDWRQAGPALGDRAFASFENPINLAGYLAMVIPVAFALALSPRRSWARPAGVVLILAVVALVFTSSRGGWLAAGIGIAIVSAGLWRAPAMRPKIAIGLAAAAMVIGLLGATPNYRGRLVSSVRLEGSAATRISIWQSTAMLITDRPVLGWGLETFREAFPTRRQATHVTLAGPMTLPDRPHNQLLYIAFAAGLAGLASYLWVLARLGRISGRLLAGGDVMAVGLAGALAAYVVQEQFAFSGGSTTPIFWLLAAAACNLAERSEPSTARRRLAPAAVALALAGLLIVPTVIFVGADYAYARGLRGQTEADVRADLRLAVRLNPLRGQYREALASVLLSQYEQDGDRTAATEALDLYRRGLRLNPSSHDLYCGLAGAEYAVAKKERLSMAAAAGSIDKGLRLQPYCAAGLRRRAWIYASEGRWAAAVKQMRSSARLVPGDMELLGDLRYLEKKARRSDR